MSLSIIRLNQLRRTLRGVGPKSRRLGRAEFRLQMTSESRFNEYIPSRPLIGLGFFSCLEENKFLNRL